LVFFCNNLSNSKSKGIFSGFSISGKVLQTNGKENRRYYDNPAIAPWQILMNRVEPPRNKYWLKLIKLLQKNTKHTVKKLDLSPKIQMSKPAIRAEEENETENNSLEISDDVHAHEVIYSSHNKIVAKKPLEITNEFYSPVLEPKNIVPMKEEKRIIIRDVKKTKELLEDSHIEIENLENPFDHHSSDLFPTV
jgi:hypothetical protein